MGWPRVELGVLFVYTRTADVPRDPPIHPSSDSTSEEV